MVGTSGYLYAHWQNIFYPQGLVSSQWLNFYAQYFKGLELNVTFYRLPSANVFKNWYKKTPADFRFILKGWRFITHIKKLNAVAEPLKAFLNQASFLKEKLLGILWQFPPSLKCQPSKLKNFLKLLKRYAGGIHAFEFRDPSWFKPQVYALLKEFNFTLCIVDSCCFPSQEVITSSAIYLRFHGRERLYASNYSEEDLKIWGEKIKGWCQKNKIEYVLAFFNNDFGGFAVKNALTFKRLLENSLT